MFDLVLNFIFPERGKSKHNSKCDKCGRVIDPAKVLQGMLVKIQCNRCNMATNCLYDDKRYRNIESGNRIRCEYCGWDQIHSPTGKITHP